MSDKLISTELPGQSDPAKANAKTFWTTDAAMHLARRLIVTVS